MSLPAGARVLVVEDDEDTAELLRLYLEQEGHEVIRTSRGDEGLEQARHRRPELVVLDLMLPGLDGRELCRRLRRESDVPILMLTALTREDDRLHGFELGADDYVAKPFSPREVVHRVRALLRRATPAGSGSLLRFESLELDRERRTLHRDGVRVHLTATEFCILHALMRSPHRVFTREDLVASLGRDFPGHLRSLDAHVGNLRRKLGLEGASRRYVETVIGVGYRLARAPA